MLIEELDEEFLHAIENTIAARPSGSAVQGFYRPGERASDSVPFDVVPTKCPPFGGQPTGRKPTPDDKRGAWQLQQEYVEGRLGKDAAENGRLWNDAKWIDKHYRIATLEADATMPHNLVSGEWGDYVDPAAIFGDQQKGVSPSYGITGIAAYETLLMMERAEEFDALRKIDVNRLVAEAGPRTIRSDFPSPEERAESGKIIRMLMAGLRSLWWPVKQAVVDHATMSELGENVGAKVAAAVGRQRVIEGLRLAGSIRRGIAQQERVLDGPPRSIMDTVNWGALLGSLRVSSLPPRLLPANDNSPRRMAA